MQISVREMLLSDAGLIADYFLSADPEFITGMGAYPEKLPERNNWLNLLHEEYHKPYKKKNFYYIIWLLDNDPIGHSNINGITFGNETRMHLHIWKTNNRTKGLGYEFLRKSIPFYFKNFQLKKLVCEPYARNPAPLKTMEKVGFKFIKEYETTPGWINFHQKVKRYEMNRSDFIEKQIP